MPRWQSVEVVRQTWCAVLGRSLATCWTYLNWLRTRNGSDHATFSNVSDMLLLLTERTSIPNKTPFNIIVSVDFRLYFFRSFYRCRRNFKISGIRRWIKFQLHGVLAFVSQERGNNRNGMHGFIVDHTANAKSLFWNRRKRPETPPLDGPPVAQPSISRSSPPTETARLSDHSLHDSLCACGHHIRARPG